MKVSELKTKYRKISPEIQKKVKRDLAFQTGLQVERIRIYKGLTQEKLAKIINTKQSSISRVESGSVLPSLGFLKKIADALGLYLTPPRFVIPEEDLSCVTISSETVSTDKDVNGIKYPYVQTGGNKTYDGEPFIVYGSEAFA